MSHAIVFLPGLMCDARLFAPQLKAFEKGKVVNTTGQDTITEMAKMVLSIAPKKFALAGLSMGGIIAMELLRLAPDRVTQLALIDTSYLAESRETAASRLSQIKAVKAGGLSKVMSNDLIPKYSGNKPLGPDIVETCKAMANDLGPDVFIHQSQALMGRRDHSDTLRAVTCPTLILCGVADKLCPVSRHQEMAQLVAHSKLEIIEGAGHLPTLEFPTETTTVLGRWLGAT